MLSRVFCAATIGVDARLIEVEIHFGGGLPRYFLVGLPDRAVSESRDRIEAALRSSGDSFPRGRITVNLAPAALPKEGSSFDLPIALVLLAVSGQAGADRLKATLAVGELALDGKLRPVRGVLPIALEAKRRGLRHLIVPRANAAEAAVVDGIRVLAFRDLRGVKRWLNGSDDSGPAAAIAPEPTDVQRGEVPDFSDVRGQESARRAVEVAAAGGHNLLMVGPPGAGKTMIARRIPGILPPLTPEEAVETTKIHSVAGTLLPGRPLVGERPFRAPHHTISAAALAGGGSIPVPGEISLAHNGVLFLDELPEFRRSSLEVLRQPLEDGCLTIARARMSVTFPGRVMLIASMNPSPSGDWYDPADPDSATPDQIRRYLRRISGPLLDRVDIQIDVEKVTFEELSSKGAAESSVRIRERVISARKRQQKRLEPFGAVHCNAQMSGRMVRRCCGTDDAGAVLLRKAMQQLGLSARAYDRILKVARTIADLEGSERIGSHHIAEAVQYRSLDREGWLMRSSNP